MQKVIAGAGMSIAPLEWVVMVNVWRCRHQAASKFTHHPLPCFNLSS